MAYVHEQGEQVRLEEGDLSLTHQHTILSYLTQKFTTLQLDAEASAANDILIFDALNTKNVRVLLRVV
jgi:hypothetical protein